MVIKRKAASTLVRSQHESLAGKLNQEEVAEMEMGAEEENKQEEEADSEVQHESEEVKFKREQEEWKIARTNELKGMYVDDLKTIVTNNGLQVSAKKDMVDAVIKLEKKERVAKHEKDLAIRQVIIEKREELASMPLAQLKSQCKGVAIASEGKVSKEDMIQQLLKIWLDHGGVDRALKKKERDGRRSDLYAMDNEALQKICTKFNIDPLVRDVMADRVLRRETENLQFLPPASQHDEAAPAASTKAQKEDIIDTLLADEANRKREKELQKVKEEAAKAKVNELKEMSVDALKKLLTSKGLEASGHKDELIKAAFSMLMQEEALVARKKDLKAMGKNDLMELLSSKGLETGGSTAAMVETVLAYEAKVREDLHTYTMKVQEIVSKKKEELEGKTNDQLKELCLAYGLKVGVGKEDRIERLVEKMQQGGGEVDRMFSQMQRSARKQELYSMDTLTVLDLCKKLEVDPLMKEVMIERILAYEADVEDGVVEPVSKKPRTFKP